MIVGYFGDDFATGDCGRLLVKMAPILHLPCSRLPPCNFYSLWIWAGLVTCSAQQNTKMCLFCAQTPRSCVSPALSLPYKVKPGLTCWRWELPDFSNVSDTLTLNKFFFYLSEIHIELGVLYFICYLCTRRKSQLILFWISQPTPK